MGKMLKIELTRAFKNKTFAFVLLFCAVLIAMQVMEYVIPSLPFLYERSDELMGQTIPSLFLGNAFLGFGGGLAYSIFQWTLPILIVLPYASSAYAEQKQGYVKNIFLRTKKKNYYIAKYIAVFLNGGAVAVIPVLTSLWVSAHFLPAVLPSPTSGQTPISANSMWGELFYSQPLAYIFRYLVLQFVFYGLMATIALSVSYLAGNRFVVLLSPFLLNLFVSFLCGWLRAHIFAPTVFLDMRQMVYHINFEVIAIEILILFILTSLSFILTGCRKEVY